MAKFTRQHIYNTAKELSNWGRWGENDQLGTLNNITPEDIVGNTMTDAFEIEDNTATVVIGISQDNLNEDNESLIFAIDGTSAQVSVLIESDAATLTEEEKFRRDDSSSSPLIPSEDPKLPIVGDIITDDDGGIIYVPIVDLSLIHI